MHLTVTRRQWGAKDPKAYHPLVMPIKVLVFAKTFTTPCRDLEDCINHVRGIQDRNMFKYNLADIRYNFLISPDSSLFVGRGWKMTPTLPKKYRYLTSEALFVGLIGFFKDSPPPQQMMWAKERLIKFGIFKKYVSPKFLEFNI